MPIYEFVCTLGHVTERQVSWEITHTVCDTCGIQATKIPKCYPTEHYWKEGEHP